MLKKITKWETEDGKVFDTQEEAEDYMFEQEKEVMTHTTEQDRADFEAVASGLCKWPKAIERDTNGDYLLMQTASGWVWWQLALQGARRAPAVPVPQGWKPVPVEATQEMIEAWGNATELPEGMVERSDDEVNAYAAQRDWKAMLAVAPAVVVVPDERSAFEAWAESVGLDHLERGFGKQDDYAFVETRRMWGAWQGRAALAATPAAPMKEE